MVDTIYAARTIEAGNIDNSVTVADVRFMKPLDEGVLSPKELAADAAADRMKAAMNWVLGVRPSLLQKVDLLDKDILN